MYRHATKRNLAYALCGPFFVVFCSNLSFRSCVPNAAQQEIESLTQLSCCRSDGQIRRRGSTSWWASECLHLPGSCCQKQ